jgi:hypothetical protein
MNEGMRKRMTTAIVAQAAEIAKLREFADEFLRLTEDGRMLMGPGPDHIPGLRALARLALTPEPKEGT